MPRTRMRRAARRTSLADRLLAEGGRRSWRRCGRHRTSRDRALMSETVVVTASAGSFPGLAVRCGRYRWRSEERPLMSFAPPVDWAPLDRALERLARFHGMAFTSPRAASAFAARLGQRRDAHPSPEQLPPLWASGAATAERPGPLGPVQTPSSAADRAIGAAAALARAMLASRAGGPVLFPCGELRRDELPARLRQEGIEVEEVVCYRSVLARDDGGQVRRGARLVCWWWRAPASPSSWLRACPPEARPPILAVGPTTAAAARAAGWPPAGGGRGAHRRGGGYRGANPAHRCDERSVSAGLPARSRSSGRRSG